MKLDFGWTPCSVGIVVAVLMSFVLVSVVARPIYAQSSTDQSAPDFTDQQLEFFENKVRPLLIEKCFDCHGPESTPIEGGLNLSSRKAILVGGDTGPAIVSGLPDKSLMIDAINYGEVYEMPPDTKMSDEEIGVFAKWVELGAPWPKSSDVEVATKREFDLEARKSAHWCWQPIRRPAIPEVERQDWSQDPIDHFILAGLESAGLEPADPAARRTLIRRLYLDIVGLPPTPLQVDAFVEDSSTRAVERVVDELLASPQYGERWARHWMDLTRYAESGGHEFDYEIRHAFQYRDYLIRAFNSDVPYKQFVHEHIAGDLIDEPRRHPTDDFNESILGTGSWFLGEAKHSPVDAKEEEARTIDNQIDVMSKTFLGLTVACARCHDHKFDAISTEDYYALSGFLQSSRRQAVMLDPGRKIETSFNQVEKVVSKASRLSQKLIRQLNGADANRVASYLNAGLKHMRLDPQWNQENALLVEGESLTQLSVAGGETLPQKINKREVFEWSGNEQFWWKHGNVGDAWVLEFDVPDNSDAYEIEAVFTKAADYGAAQIQVNDQVAVENVDFYDPELKTIKVAIGKHSLNLGKNQLKIVLAEHHADAAPSNMIGIDLLKLTPVNQPSDQVVQSLESLAEHESLDAKLLENLVAAIRDPAIRDPGHPLHWVYRGSRASQALDSTIQNVLKTQHETAEKKNEKWLDESTLFADFSNGIPSGWFKTGFAFGDSKTPPGADQDSPLFSSVGSIIPRSDTVHSGKFGANFYGVIRSPTFELNHSHIHYRCRGENVTIRLIIDGYMMDEFNPLLFNGCRITIGKSGQFHWETQASDVKNHIGHRAHIEILDHGNGYVELDEIRFSNGAQPVDPPSPLERGLAAGDIDSLDTFAASVADSLSRQLHSDQLNAEIASWTIDHELAAVFSSADPGKIKVSNEESTPDASSVVFVSARNDRREYETSELAKLNSELRLLRDEMKKMNARIPAPDFAIAMTEGTGEEERVFVRGNHKTLGGVATRRFLSAISDRPLNPSDGSGRLQLARKMTAPNNPLTNRVAVNRIWHHMFGRGIVGSVDNLGVLGEPPTHPELLDYLATEFAADGQSLKRMIKRLALTSTYQMSSRPSESGFKIDPDNKLLHRARIRRLQGEAIRDSLLWISGDLDLKMYGPPVPIHLTSFMTGRGRPSKSGPLNGAGRRSVYIAVRRNFLSPMMLAFDTPIPFNATGARNQSNVPAQALILMNDPFVIEQAKHWSTRLLDVDQSNQQRVETIYLTALGRNPTTDELEKALRFLQQQAVELGIPVDAINQNQDVWQDFCHVVFNLKEFIYIQ